MQLIYLSYKSCLNIVFVVEQLSYHNSNLQVCHLCIVKQVLPYLKRTIMLGIE